MSSWQSTLQNSSLLRISYFKSCLLMFFCSVKTTLTLKVISCLIKATIYMYFYNYLISFNNVLPIFSSTRPICSPNPYLCFCVRSGPGELAVAPQLGKFGVQLMGEYHGQGHALFCLVSRVTKHQTLQNNHKCNITQLSMHCKAYLHFNAAVKWQL